MTLRRSTIHPDILAAVQSDSTALRLASTLDGLFTLTGYKRVRKHKESYVTIFCKPTSTISKALLIEREVVAVIARFSDIHARTVSIAEEVIAQHAPQLERTLAIVVHGDEKGDEKLRSWGRERGLTIVPICHTKKTPMPTSDTFRRRIAVDVFSGNSFDVTGPVIEDIDFFGRRNEASELVRQLEHGRIRSLFGIRKAGKTSLINRSVKLAREVGTPKIAFIDCSVKEFYNLAPAEALGAVMRTCRSAITSGYANVVDHAIRKGPPEGLSSWLAQQRVPLAIVFDEVDYISPDSTVATHWRSGFADFWRDIRVSIQESQRQGGTVSLLVSGVSSRYFRRESVEGVENPVLQFLPDNYLGPFADEATDAMLRDLGRRCGIQWESESRKLIATVCGNLPFWVRLAGSYVHRAIAIDARPVVLDRVQTEILLNQFVAYEGADVAMVAVENLLRVFPELYDRLQECIRAPLPLTDGALLIRYGLAQSIKDRAEVTSKMVLEGVRKLEANRAARSAQVSAVGDAGPEEVGDVARWAEELSTINKRRNVLELSIRNMIRFGLKARQGKTSWHEQVLAALPEERRKALQPFAADALMSKLYWKELGAIVSKEWAVFEPTLGDKARFLAAMELVNDRPDTHAKDVDPADIALQRRELAWLEERVLT